MRAHTDTAHTRGAGKVGLGPNLQIISLVHRVVSGFFFFWRFCFGFFKVFVFVFSLSFFLSFICLFVCSVLVGDEVSSAVFGGHRRWVSPPRDRAPPPQRPP